MNKYSDYFEISDCPEAVCMDQFISEAMRTDLLFPNDASKLNFLKSAQITLRNEVLTCYQFLKEKGLLQEYHFFRDGE